jgi:hypothetical protein
MASRPVQQRGLPTRKAPYERVLSPLDALKDEIHHLYIVEDKELKEVIALIKRDHGVDQS